MQKLLLLSVVIFLICLPILAARDRSATRSLKKTLAIVLAFNVLYWLALRFVYGRL
jgi:hypothetical protein